MQMWFSRIVDLVYSFEGRWGVETYAPWGAAAITLLVFAQMAIDSLRLGFPWFSSLVRAFLWSAWIYPLVYCLIIQTPIWLTLLLSLGLGVGGTLLSSYIFGRQPPRAVRKSG
ncbi:MAG: hypothetical protein HPY50_21775 [Firmicutes bacterium]|nr:hypothetical protein [Bacillota bacterium]